MFLAHIIILKRMNILAASLLLCAFIGYSKSMFFGLVLSCVNNDIVKGCFPNFVSHFKTI